MYKAFKNKFRIWLRVKLFLLRQGLINQSNNQAKGGALMKYNRMKMMRMMMLLVH